MQKRKAIRASKRRTTVTGLAGVIENEIRPALDRLRTADAALERRIEAVEEAATRVEGAIVDLKNDMGGSLTIVLDKLTKLADKVGAER